MSDQTSGKEPEPADAAKTDPSRENPQKIGMKRRLSGAKDFSIKKKKKSYDESMWVSGPGSDEALVCSTKSDRSIDFPINFRDAPAEPGVQQREFQGITSGPPHMKSSGPGSDEASVCSAESDWSMESPLNFKPAPAGQSGQTSSPQKQETLKEFDSKAMVFLRHVLEMHKKVLSGEHRVVFEDQEQEAVVDDELLMGCDEETREAALKIALCPVSFLSSPEHGSFLKTPQP